MQREVVDARKLELDLQVDSILLEAEAKKRQASASQVLKDGIAKVQEPTEAEVQTFQRHADVLHQRQARESHHLGIAESERR